MMTMMAPFYSSNPNLRFHKKVYHNNDRCKEGKNIEPPYLKQGTGNRPLCKQCRKLNFERK